jgi:sugar-specific transcriptional regulator TrmB
MSRVLADYDDELKTLCNLGLTRQQAKVYLAIAKIGQASVQEASKAAKIDRGECYRIVCQLTEKNLISKILTFPIKYEAIFSNAGIQDLLEKKKNEVSSLENNMGILLEKLKTKDKVPIEERKNSIRFLPIGPTLVEAMKSHMTSISKSIEAIVDVEWFESTHNLMYEAMTDALQRGVKYRLIISDSKGTFDIRRISNYCKNKGFDFRITSQEIGAPMCILDEKIARIFISDENQILKSSCLFTSNERMTVFTQCYFDNIWKMSKKVKQKNIVT